MSNSEILKEYLLEKENAYLLDDNNNAKTIMLSGAWGSGKTYFWQDQIEPKLKKLKICIYVSLYGKESIDEIKFEIFKEAYNSQVSEDFISKSASLLHSIAPSFGEKSLTAGFEKLNKESKTKKAEEFLKEGSIICFDDFERKSEKINLNDLFGFISQLSIELNSKTVIILNSEVFKDKDAEIFNRVKEKTISKFFYFNPSIEELFESISYNDKYNNLNDYKKYILSAIEETEELNARIYVQVLDNCLEWLSAKRVLDSNSIRVLVLGTFNFVLNHLILDYQTIKVNNDGSGLLEYNVIPFYSNTFKMYTLLRARSPIEHMIYTNSISEEESIRYLKSLVTKVDVDKRPKLLEKNQEEHINWITSNESKLKALWKYGYRLYYVSDVDEDTYNEISEFIKSGILI